MVDIAGTEQAVTNTVENVLGAIAHAIHAADGPPPLEVDDDGWIRGPGVTCTDETKKRQSLAPSVDHIEGIAWHWTDTRGCGAMNLAERLLNPDNDRSASWHSVIDALGNSAQSVSAKHGSWHCGSDTTALFTREVPGTWVPLTPQQRGKMRGYSGNSFLYGIELECPGEVREVGGEWLGWPFAKGTKYGPPAVVPAAEVIPLGLVITNGAQTRRGYAAFTAAQAETAQRIASALVRRYGLRRAMCAFGHCQLDPTNRTDPGPLWLGYPVPPLGSDLVGHPAGMTMRGRLADILDAIFGSGS